MANDSILKMRVPALISIRKIQDLDLNPRGGGVGAYYKALYEEALSQNQSLTLASYLDRKGIPSLYL